MKKMDPVRRAYSRRMIGRYLKRARLAAGFTRREVFLTVDVSLQQLRDYENGLASLPLSTFGKLVELYGADREKATITMQQAGRVFLVH